ncbi:MAG: radical SAM protein [Candidatus Njordarchaeales archaeon]
MVRYGEKKVRSIMSKSGIYGIEYAINPYIGCEHGCVYCYARFVYIKMGKDPLEWGEEVIAKTNAVELLKREVVANRRGRVLISSVTDPYQPIERTKLLTRRILETLQRYKYPVVILTKSPLILRDLDIIKKFNHEEVEAGITITMLNDDDRKVFEPRAPSVDARIKALRILAGNIANTFAFLGPIIPLFTTKDLSALLELIADAGVKRVVIDKLNLKARNWESINRALKENYDKAKIREFWRILRDPYYYKKLKKKIINEAGELGLQVDFCY